MKACAITRQTPTRCTGIAVNFFPRYSLAVRQILPGRFIAPLSFELWWGGKMNFRSVIIPAALAIVAVGAAADRAAQAETLFGKAQALGKGTAKAYAVTGADGKPTAIGVAFKAGLLDGLPPERNKTSRCADLDKNGRINDKGECDGDYELRLALPAAIAGRTDIPVRWIAMGWNPHGHPPAVWSVPHFDFHFYMVGEKAVDAIRIGTCPIFIDCEDKKRALKKVPAKYVHPEHVSVGAAVGRMGDHLIDVKTPEMAKKDPKPFTHTMIFGAYDGGITFYEPMIALDYLQGRPASGCMPIKQPKAWARAGYYPTLYCIRHSKKHATYTVSLEGMRLRERE